MTQYHNRYMKNSLHRKLLRALPLLVLFFFMNCSYGLINLFPKKVQNAGASETTGDVTAYTTGGGPTFNMVYVEDGLEFRQGVDDAGDIVYGPTHMAPATATVSSAFEIAETEVTYELWYAVRNWAASNGYTFINLGREGDDGTAGDPPTGAQYEPVTYVNWRDSIVWCNALTEYYNAQNGTSLECVYTSDGGYSSPLRDLTDTNSGSYFLNPGELDNPYVNPGAKGFRLPTTTEWGAASRWEGSSAISADAYEYPASSGIWWTSGDYASGGTGPYTGVNATDYPNFDPFAWYGDTTTAPNGNAASTQPVKGRTANALGLYDMSGNVWEWNFDWHPDYSGSARVRRGGSWFCSSISLRVGSWNYINPCYEYDYIGFRFCRTP